MNLAFASSDMWGSGRFLNATIQVVDELELHACSLLSYLPKILTLSCSAPSRQAICFFGPVSSVGLSLDFGSRGVFAHSLFPILKKWDSYLDAFRAPKMRPYDTRTTSVWVPVRSTALFAFHTPPLPCKTLREQPPQCTRP